MEHNGNGSSGGAASRFAVGEGGAQVDPAGNIRSSGTLLRRGRLRALVARPPDEPCVDVAQAVERYEGYVNAIACNAGMRDDRAEIVQETFLALGEWRRRHDGAMPERVSSFLATVAWRRIYDCLRRRRADLDHVSDDGAELMPASQRDPEQALIGAQTAYQVRFVLERMRPRDALLLLQLADGMSSEEIATSLGCLVVTARVRLSRAKARFIALARQHHLDIGGSP